jgi:serine/threonine protein phosphatase PrpC
MEIKAPNIPFSAPRQYRFTVVTSTSQGARDHQEDACGHWSDPSGTRLFAVVADGAGGHGGGADASKAAVDSAALTWEKNSSSNLAAPDAFLAQWVEDAHLAVIEASAKIQRSGRSVVVACFIDGSSVHWVHAGDCRLLRFGGGKLVERTRDDSVVQVLFERGEITEEEMGTHPDQSRLLQSLGGEDAPTPRPGNAEVEAGDGLILCSDGFWEHLKQAELEKLIGTPPAKRQEALDQAVAEAVRRGGAKADNTTAMMIVFGEDKGGSRSGIRWVILLLFAALVGCAAGWWWGGRPSELRHLWEKVRVGLGRSAPSREPIIRSKALESATKATKNPPVAPPASEAGPSSGEVKKEPHAPSEQKP